MADFEDNNPFAGSDRRSSSATDNDSVNDQTDNFGNSTLAHGSHLVVDRKSPDDRPAPTTRAYSSRAEQILTETPDVNITIVDAGKSHEGNSRGFIAYTIKLQDLTVRRRYSEFESLRSTLVKLFPTLIIPPIPEKHSMSDYAASPTKAKEDSSIIEHRQRMLAVFLNRCRSMKQVKESSVFQRFLDPNSSWSEVLNSPPVSNLPKSILRAPPLDPSQPSPAHLYLPLPSSSAKLKLEEDSTFDEVEKNAKEYENVIAGGLERATKRIIKRYSDLATDYSELGARFNAFSLEEEGALARSIEKIGQSIDNSYIATDELINALSSSFSEPLGESAQFAVVVRSVLKFRRQKAIQEEMTLESLKAKKESLEVLERAEKEAQRINSYLQREGITSESLSITPNSIPPPPHLDDSSQDGLEPTGEENEEEGSLHSTGKKSGSSGFKIPGMSKLNHALHGIIDVDPETTRRNNIGKTREQIGQLEESLAVAKTDVVDANTSVKHDLERFQHTKEEDLRRIMIAYMRCHIEWAKKNLDSWKEAKAEVEKL